MYHWPNGLWSSIASVLCHRVATAARVAAAVAVLHRIDVVAVARCRCRGLILPGGDTGWLPLVAHGLLQCHGAARDLAAVCRCCAAIVSLPSHVVLGLSLAQCREIFTPSALSFTVFA